MSWFSPLLSINTKVDLFIAAVAGLYNIQSCFIQYKKMLHVRDSLQPAFMYVTVKSGCAGKAGKRFQSKNQSLTSPHR